MSRQDEFERLLASLHEAVLDDAHWPATSALIDEAFGTKGNMLVYGSGASSDDVVIYLARLCYRGERNEALERKYFEEYHPWDERVPRLRTLADSRLVHVSDLYTVEEKKTSAAYNEALPLAETQNCLNVRMDGPNGSRIVWSFGDPVEADGWSLDRIEFIRGLLPHFRHYVIVRQALVDARALGASTLALLDNHRVGVIHLDRHGNLMTANDRARAILRRADGLTDRDGALRASLSAEDAELQKMLSRAMPFKGGAGTGGSVTVSREHAATQVVLHVNPINQGDAQARAGRVGALVLVVDPEERWRIDADRVGAILGLTPAQSHVATMLAEGLTIRDIAVATGRSVTTVKWHLGHIFAGVGVSRQADLVRLVLSSADLPDVRS